MSARGRRARADGGQSTVEFALVLPLVVVVLLLVVQVGLVVRDQVLVVHAAREAVRAASVGDSNDQVRRAAAAAGPLDADRLTVVANQGGDPDGIGSGAGDLPVPNRSAARGDPGARCRPGGRCGHDEGAMSVVMARSMAMAPALSNGSLPLPHLGDWTQDGQPLSHGQDWITSRVASRWRSALS